MQHLLQLSKKTPMLKKLGIWLLFLVIVVPTLQVNGQVTATLRKKLGRFTNENRLSIQFQTDDGGYIMAGTSTEAPNYGGADFWIIKTDAAFNIHWTRNFGGTGNDRLSRVLKTSDGNYLLAGTSASVPSGNKTAPLKSSVGWIDSGDLWIVKITPAGTKLWDYSYGGDSEDSNPSVVETEDGGFLINSTSNSNKSGDKSQDRYPSYFGQDLWLVKINKDGIKQWDRIYSGVGGDEYAGINSILKTRDGNYLIGGQTESKAGNDKSQDGFGGEDYWIIKIRPDGSKIWDKVFGGTSEERLEGLNVHPKGGYVISGTSFSSKGGNKTSELGTGYSSHWWFTLTEDGEKTDESSYSGPESHWTSAGTSFYDENGYYHAYSNSSDEEASSWVHVIHYDWNNSKVWEWIKRSTENYPWIYGHEVFKNREDKIIVGIAVWGESLNLYELNPNGSTFTKFEGETFATSADVGSYPIGKVNSSTFSNWSSARIFDVGDKIKVSFTSAGEQIKVKARVRSGAYSKTSSWANPTSFWPDGYRFYVDGVRVMLTGNQKTVSERNSIYGGSFWGTMESGVIDLPAGTHEFEIESNKMFAGVDYIEIERFPLSASEIQEVTKSKSDKKGIYAYPNPIANTINIGLPKSSGSASYILTDTRGNVFKKGTNIEIHQSSMAIDVSTLDLKPGLYFVKVKSSTGEKTVKVYKE